METKVVAYMRQWEESDENLRSSLIRINLPVSVIGPDVGSDETRQDLEALFITQLEIMRCEPMLFGPRMVDYMHFLSTVLLNNGKRVEALVMITQAHHAFDGQVFWEEAYVKHSVLRALPLGFPCNRGVKQALELVITHADILVSLGAPIEEMEVLVSRIKTCTCSDAPGCRELIDMIRKEMLQTQLRNYTTCQHCFKEANEDMPACPCGKARYCDINCQAQHWPYHKRFCGPDLEEARQERKRARRECRRKWFELASGKLDSELLRVCKLVIRWERVSWRKLVEEKWAILNKIIDRRGEALVRSLDMLELE
jgi:hypothetical protein